MSSEREREEVIDWLISESATLEHDGRDAGFGADEELLARAAAYRRLLAILRSSTPSEEAPDE